MKRLFNHIVVISMLLLVFESCKKDDPEDVKIPLQSMAFSQESLAIAAGDSVRISLQLVPANTTDTITWTSDNEKVATVKNGMVKALARGTATIQAKSGSLTSNCNVTVSKVDLPYQLVWFDEFDTPQLNTTKWNIEIGGGGWGNQEKQYYTNRSDNLRIEDGALIIQAKKEVYSTNNYTSARINTKNKAAFKYGRIEARISMPAGKGTWPAFWLLGANIDTSRWPLCGEVDIVEHIGSQPTLVSHAVHTYEKNGTKGNNWVVKKYFDNVENNYHIYAIEWEEKANEGDDCISFYFDGTKTTTLWEPHVNSTNQVWPFNQNFFVILNLAIGGNMGGTIDDAAFGNPVIMKVDYIRVYQRK